MDAALEVFADKGLKNATMDDVAERAELSKGSLYNYFKTKEHLFFAIDQRAGLMLRERFAEAARTEKVGRHKVRAIGRAYYNFCFDHPNYFKAMSYVDRLDPKTFKAVAEEMMIGGLSGYKESSLAVLAEAIEVGQADGSISKEFNPWTLSILLWSTSNGVIHMIKNRGESFKLLNLSIDRLYEAKEQLVDRGLARHDEASENKE